MRAHPADEKNARVGGGGELTLVGSILLSSLSVL